MPDVSRPLRLRASCSTAFCARESAGSFAPLREAGAALELAHPIRVMIADRSWLKLEVPNRIA
jgi:hypothetical protein